MISNFNELYYPIKNLYYPTLNLYRKQYSKEQNIVFLMKLISENWELLGLKSRFEVVKSTLNFQHYIQIAYFIETNFIHFLQESRNFIIPVKMTFGDYKQCYIEEPLTLYKLCSEDMIQAFIQTIIIKEGKLEKKLNALLRNQFDDERLTIFKKLSLKNNLLELRELDRMIAQSFDDCYNNFFKDINTMFLEKDFTKIKNVVRSFYDSQKPAIWYAYKRIPIDE